MSDFFCTKCGEDVPADATVCPHCGDAFETRPRQSRPPEASVGWALFCLILNLVAPGLGSVLGARFRGFLQGGLVLTGIIVGSASHSTLILFVLGFVAWAWALATSISMVDSAVASTAEAAARRALLPASPPTQGP